MLEHDQWLTHPCVRPLLPNQAQDYRIQYDSIVRLFVLPKSNTPHTLVVVSLDPPIRKGQTYYPHILVQFPSDEERSVQLDLSDEALAAKNEKVGVTLQGFFCACWWRLCPACRLLCLQVAPVSGRGDRSMMCIHACTASKCWS
jgi:hypothetical protein